MSERTLRRQAARQKSNQLSIVSKRIFRSANYLVRKGLTPPFVNKVIVNAVTPAEKD